MDSEVSLAKMFKYDPEMINFSGFNPDIAIFNSLRHFLGKEAVLRRFSLIENHRRMVNPGFSSEHTEDRQEFFGQIDSSPNIKKRFFDKGLPKVGDLRKYASYERFAGFCQDILETIETARETLGHFGGLSEATHVLDKVNKFDSGLEKMLTQLRILNESDIFAFNTSRGTFQAMESMPEDYISPNSEEAGKVLDDVNAKYIRVELKKEAIRIAKRFRESFRVEIMDWTRSEFKYNPKKENLRSAFEKFAMTVRLHQEYQDFVEGSRYDEKQLARLTLEEDHGEWWKDMYKSMPREELARLIEEDSGIDIDSIPDKTTPFFDDRYDIQGVFPPTLMSRYNVRGAFVPIDFQTEPGENKFFLTGLHSGGKSFFLENILMLQVLGNLGVDPLGNSITLPKYEKMFYHKSIGQANYGVGTAETELRDVGRVIREAGQRDVIAIDELLDSANAGIASSLSPRILGDLMSSPATVFVSSHRNSDYSWLTDQGWTLLHPGHTIKDGKIAPTYRLERGSPNEEANMRYMEQRFENIFGE